MSHDLVNYCNPMWLQQWLRLQCFRCYTHNTVLPLEES